MTVFGVEFAAWLCNCACFRLISSADSIEQEMSQGRNVDVSNRGGKCHVIGTRFSIIILDSLVFFSLHVYCFHLHFLTKQFISLSLSRYDLSLLFLSLYDLSLLFLSLYAMSSMFIAPISSLLIACFA